MARADGDDVDGEGKEKRAGVDCGVRVCRARIVMPMTWYLLGRYGPIGTVPL